MANQKISALPRKYTLSTDDFIPIVDSQFGATNYINKKVTVGDLLGLTQVVVNNQVSALNPVISVNGYGGLVELGVSQLADAIVTQPQANDFLVYSATDASWHNKKISETDFVIDCGEF
jgi:hypothetical protein